MEEVDSQTSIPEDNPRLKNLMEKRIEWEGKGLVEKNNPFVNEIMSSGTLAEKPITEIEDQLRYQNFLGDNENLIILLEFDQAEVNSLGLKHADLAKNLQEAYFSYEEATFRKKDEAEMTILGKNYKIKSRGPTRGFYESPFLKNKQSVHYLDATAPQTTPISVIRPDGKELQFTPILVHFIRDVGFYGGLEKSARISPQEIADFFEISPKT